MRELKEDDAELPVLKDRQVVMLLGLKAAEEELRAPEGEQHASAAATVVSRAVVAV